MLKYEIEKIRNLIKLTDFSGALKRLNKINTKDLKIKELDELLAYVYFKLGNYQESLDLFLNLLKEDKYNFQIIKGIIENYIATNKYELALSFIENVSKDFNNEELIYYKAFLNLKLNNLETALNYYLDYIKINNNNEKIFNDIGIIYKNLNKFDEAINYFLKAIRIDPNYFTALYNIALVYFQIGNLDKSEYFFKKALRVNKNYPEIYNYLGMIDIHRKRYDSAFKNLNKALEKDPENLNAKNNLAILYDYTNNVVKAEELYKELINKSSKNYIYYVNLANILNREKKYNDSLQYLINGLKKFPTNSKIISKIGETYYLQGKLDESYNYYIKSLKCDINNVEALKGLGFIFYDKNDLKEALNYFKKAYELDKNDIYTLAKIADIYYDLKNYELAIEYYNKIIQIDENNIDALNKLGQLYIDLKSYSYGLKILNKVKKLDPDNVYPYLILADYYKNNNMLKEALEEYMHVLNIKSLRSGSNLSIFTNSLEEYEKIIKKLSGDKYDKLFSIQEKFKKTFVPKNKLIGKDQIFSDELLTIEKNFDTEKLGTQIYDIESIEIVQEEEKKEVEPEKIDNDEVKDLFELGGVLDRKKLSENYNEEIKEEDKNKNEKKENEEEKNEEEEELKNIFNLGDIGKNKLSDDEYDKNVLDKLNEIKNKVYSINVEKDIEGLRKKFTEVPSTFEEKYKIEDYYEEDLLPDKEFKIPKKSLKYQQNESQENVVPPININVEAPSNIQPIPNFYNQNLSPITPNLSTNLDNISSNISKGIPEATKLSEPITTTQETSPKNILQNPSQTPSQNPIYIPQPVYIPQQFQQPQISEIYNQPKPFYNTEEQMNKQKKQSYPEEPYHPIENKEKIHEGYEEKGDNKYINDKNQENEAKSNDLKKEQNIEEQNFFPENEVIFDNQLLKVNELLNSNWNDEKERVKLIESSLKILGKYFNDFLVNLPPQQKLDIIASEKYKKLLQFIQQ